MKILIIEDDDFQSLTLRLHLEALGHSDIFIAHDLTTLKATLIDNRFDLTFCDIHLPDVDGIELLSKHITPQLTDGVVITSIVDDTIIELARGMCNLHGYSFVGVLPKPLKAENLLIELDKFSTHRKALKQAIPAIKLSDEEVINAFKEEKIFSVYQPQFSFDSGELMGVEALVRLEHAEHGIVPPASFLPQVSALGLMYDLYLTMLDKATLALAATDLAGLKLSINIDQELLNSELFDVTVQTCQQNQFPMERLVLELTEEQTYDPSPMALANFARLSLRGVRFAIDDFGTGYASLEQLIDLPISQLKIDRIFIANVVNDYKHQQLTLATIRLAHSLGFSIVAEGVEDQDTWEFLKENNVDFCQGYYTGKPMVIEELVSLARMVTMDESSDAITAPFAPIVLFDHQMVRAKATLKLLSKELPHNEIRLVNNIEKMHQELRDLPVNFIVIEADSLNSLTPQDQEQAHNIFRKKNAVALSDGKSASTNLVIPLLQKAESLSSTVKELGKYIGKAHNEKVGRNHPKLSKREQHVAQLLLAGFTNKYIAYELELSPKTVSTFKTRILQKMGVKSILELAKVLNM